jgi:hypothetical protein
MTKAKTTTREGKINYLTLQIDMRRHPHRHPSPDHTNEGVLFPVSCDGHYQTHERAAEVAEYLAEKHPHLRTYVVQIVERFDQQGRTDGGGD